MSKKQPASSPERARKRKLEIARTTLRTLDQADLAQVAGGTRNSGKYCGITHGGDF